MVAPASSHNPSGVFSTPAQGVCLEPEDGEKEELRRALRAKEAEVRGMLVRRDALIAEMESVRRELSIATRSTRGVSALTEESDRLRGDRDRLREQHANLLKAYGALRDEHAAVRKERDQLLAESDAFRAERERLRAELGRLRLECDGLRTARDRARGECDYLAALRERLERSLSELRTTLPPPPGFSADCNESADSHSTPESASPHLVTTHAATDDEPATVQRATVDGEQTNTSEPSAAQGAAKVNGSQAQDELQRIQGISAGMERTLRQNGIHTFTQIAAWTDAEIDSMARILGIKPKRIRKEGWVSQAVSLVRNGSPKLRKDVRALERESS